MFYSVQSCNQTQPTLYSYRYSLDNFSVKQSFHFVVEEKEHIERSLGTHVRPTG